MDRVEVAMVGGGQAGLAVACVGVHFLRKRKSSLLIGVGEGAGFVARRIAARFRR